MQTEFKIQDPKTFESLFLILNPTKPIFHDEFCAYPCIPNLLLARLSTSDR